MHYVLRILFMFPDMCFTLHTMQPRKGPRMYAVYVVYVCTFPVGYVYG